MNAIILAAGMGTRLKPLTDDRPKALVETAGESFFSRQLRLLEAAGIRDVTVVTGYRAEAFAPYRGRPGLSFVHNERFHDRNNLFSMLLVRDRFGADPAGTLVVEGDVWLGEDVLPKAPPASSCWFVGHRDDMRNEWVVRCDETDRVRRIDVASGEGWILSGISYWSPGDAGLLSRLIAETAAAAGSEQLFWDDVPRANLDKLEIRARRIGGGDWAEIDTLEDRAALESAIAASMNRISRS